MFVFEGICELFRVFFESCFGTWEYGCVCLNISLMIVEMGVGVCKDSLCTDNFLRDFSITSLKFYRYNHYRRHWTFQQIFCDNM